MRYLILLSVIGLVLGLPPAPGSARNDEEAVRLFNEALQLHKTARTEVQLKKAIRKYEDALEAFEKAGLKQGTAMVANNLGTLYLGRKQYDDSVHNYLRCLTISREVSNRKLEGVALRNLGTVRLNQGLADKADTYYRESLVIWRELKDRQGERDTLTRLGSIHADQGNYVKAMAY